jgi:hypothetical protein
MLELESSSVREARQAVGDFTSSEGARARHAVLATLDEITFIEKDHEDIIDLPQNRPLRALAQSLSDLIRDGCLDVQGRFQQKIWEVGHEETGRELCGVLWVGPDFREEYARRPDSMRAEMLFNMADAAFMDSRNTWGVGGYKSLDDVRQVIAGYLRTFPTGVSMTDSQKYLINSSK